MARSPTRIGRYDLITALATGGMGRIYLARATGIGGFDRKVVIKTLEVPLTAEADPAIAMFLDEARLLGLLHHQHIASVFEVGRDEEGRHYMVLDYVDGVSAHDIWERARQFSAALPLDFVLTIVSAAANGLHYAHTRRDTDGTPLGLVHRDVSPSNVMVGHDGAVQLIDFGIAMAANRKTKTQTGFVKGKVGYLSPEQVAGRDIDARTDVFALGILLYELSTLNRAFRESSDLATMQKIKAGKIVRPSQLVSEYPLELEAIVMKALQVDPGDRFADADSMRRAIEALGHRMHFVLGDAAIIEVMAQLFEPSTGATGEPPQRQSDPAFEWSASDNDLTVRRDPKELIEQLRAHREAGAPAEAAEHGRRAGGLKPRKLRAATEAADALVSSDLPLPLASPPPTPTHTPLPPPAKPPGPVSVRFTAPSQPPPIAAAAPATAARSARSVGAGLVNARLKKPRTAWIVAGVLLIAAAGGAYVAVREASSEAAAPPPATAPASPAAARAQPAPPPPIKPVHPEPAPPPSEVRIQIITHPSDATVYMDNQKIGKTPLDKTMPADPAKHTFKLQRRGYAPAHLDFELTADINEEMTLIRAR